MPSARSKHSQWLLSQLHYQSGMQLGSVKRRQKSKSRGHSIGSGCEGETDLDSLDRYLSELLKISSLPYRPWRTSAPSAKVLPSPATTFQDLSSTRSICISGASISKSPITMYSSRYVLHKIPPRWREPIRALSVLDVPR